MSYQGQWVALLGWSAAAWHLEPREEWLGWSEAQRRRRLHLLAQNSRFVILADRTRYPNLGTCALKLCLDRLSADWQAQHGHPLVALQLGGAAAAAASAGMAFGPGVACASAGL